MAIISDTTKIDKSFKFVSGKSYTTNQKGVDNEDAPSGFIVGTASVFSQDAGIPNIAPGASTSILTYYDDGTVIGRFKMTYDISSPLNKAWYASTDGSSLTQMRTTRQGNWVPPTFGNYTVRIFLTKTSSTTAPYLLEIFSSDATSPLFDYKAGILTFESDPLAAYASIAGGPPDGIQISAYRYTGPLLSQIFDGNGNYTGGLSDFVSNGLGTSLAKFVNPDKTFIVSSPHAIGSNWLVETTSLSDLFTASQIQWRGIFQLSNGQILTSGGHSVTTTLGFVAHSYGDANASYNGTGNWTVVADGLSVFNPIPSLHTIWSYNNKIIWAGAAGTGGSSLATSSDGGMTWGYAAGDPAFAIEGIWGPGTNPALFYMVGASGTIKKTSNGSSFSVETSGTAVTLHGIWGSSGSKIFTVGNTGVIRQTTGGGSWTGLTSGTSNDLYAIFGVSSTEIYAVGDSGTVLRSTDGTAVTPTWSSFNSDSAGSPLPSQLNLRGVWGLIDTGVKRVYISGYHSGTSTVNIYSLDTDSSSPTFNRWLLQTATSGPTATYNMSGGPNGVYVGCNNNTVLALHENNVVQAKGNVVVDGYMNVGLDIKTKSMKVDRDLVLGTWSPTSTGGSDPRNPLTINISKTGTVNMPSTAVSVFSTDVGTYNDYNILYAKSNDIGDHIKMKRESSTFAVELGVHTTGTTVIPSKELVTNGGFETGNLRGWSIIQTGSGIGAAPAVFAGIERPGGGVYGARIGTDTFSFVGPQTNILYQFIDVPNIGTTTLSFYVFRYTSGYYGFDQQRAEVRATDNSTVLINIFASNPAVSTGWTFFTADLTPYAGQSVSLFFYTIINNYGDGTTMYIDDISALNTGGSVVATGPSIGSVRLGDAFSSLQNPSLPYKPARAEIETANYNLNVHAYLGDIVSSSTKSILSTERTGTIYQTVGYDIAVSPNVIQATLMTKQQAFSITADSTIGGVQNTGYVQLNAFGTTYPGGHIFLNTDPFSNSSIYATLHGTGRLYSQGGAGFATNGDIAMTGGTFASTTGYGNTLTTKNIVRAWGLIRVTSGGTVTVIDGFNILGISNGGTYLVVSLGGMHNGNYAIVATDGRPDDGGFPSSITYVPDFYSGQRDAGFFLLRFQPGGSWTSIGRTVTFGLMVVGY